MRKQLKDLREDNDLNQAVLAELLNVSQSTYSRYENGSLDIPNDALAVLADYYKVSTDYLLGLTSKPERNQ